MRKFKHAEDWTPVKIDVAVDIPHIIDLSFMKGTGQQSDEIIMADDTPSKDPFINSFSITDVSFPV